MALVLIKGIWGPSGFQERVPDFWFVGTFGSVLSAVFFCPVWGFRCFLASVLLPVFFCPVWGFRCPLASVLLLVLFCSPGGFPCFLASCSAFVPLSRFRFPGLFSVWCPRLLLALVLALCLGSASPGCVLISVFRVSRGCRFSEFRFGAVWPVFFAFHGGKRWLACPPECRPGASAPSRIEGRGKKTAANLCKLVQKKIAKLTSLKKAKRHAARAKYNPRNPWIQIVSRQSNSRNKKMAVPMPLKCARLSRTL